MPLSGYLQMQMWESTAGSSPSPRRSILSPTIFFRTLSKWFFWWSMMRAELRGLEGLLRDYGGYRCGESPASKRDRDEVEDEDWTPTKRVHSNTATPPSRRQKKKHQSLWTRRPLNLSQEDMRMPTVNFTSFERLCRRTSSKS